MNNRHFAFEWWVSQSVNAHPKKKKSPFTRFAGKGEGNFFYSIFLFLVGVGYHFSALINVLGGFVYIFIWIFFLGNSVFSLNSQFFHLEIKYFWQTTGVKFRAVGCGVTTLTIKRERGKIGETAEMLLWKLRVLTNWIRLYQAKIIYAYTSYILRIFINIFIEAQCQCTNPVPLPQVLLNIRWGILKSSINPHQSFPQRFRRSISIRIKFQIVQVGCHLTPDRKPLKKNKQKKSQDNKSIKPHTCHTRICLSKSFDLWLSGWAFYLICDTAVWICHPTLAVTLTLNHPPYVNFVQQTLKRLENARKPHAKRVTCSH